jgi:rfaE bifunctional protein nucleotidyltransferase chain/domain
MMMDSLGRTPDSKIVPLEALLPVRQRCKEAGQTVVFTNGCFDILHIGHVRSLWAARALGDLLIVGVNSDRSMRELKGPQRPLMPQDERALIVASLECVDYVVIFEEVRPIELISRLRPDIHAKGGDYGPGPEGVPEAPVVLGYGGQVVVLPLVPGTSSSELIETIVERYAPADYHGYLSP